MLSGQTPRPVLRMISGTNAWGGMSSAGRRALPLWMTAETARRCGMSLTFPTPAPGVRAVRPGCGRWKNRTCRQCPLHWSSPMRSPATAALWSSWRSSPQPCPPSIGVTTGKTFSTSLTDRSWRRMMTIPLASNFALPPPSAWPTPCYPAAALPRRKFCTMRISCPSSTSTPRRPSEPWGLR